MTKKQYCKILFDALNEFEGVFFKIYSNTMKRYIYLNLDGPDDKPITFLTCFKEMDYASEILGSCKFSFENLKYICTKFDINPPTIGKSQDEMDLIESEYLLYKKINNFLPCK